MRFEELLRKAEKKGEVRGEARGEARGETRGEARGEALGIQKGYDNTIKLFRLMRENGEEALLPRVTSDRAFFKEMLQKYHLDDCLQ